jgi:hypothetical protein
VKRFTPYFCVCACAGVRASDACVRPTKRTYNFGNIIQVYHTGGNVHTDNPGSICNFSLWNWPFPDPRRVLLCVQLWSETNESYFNRPVLDPCISCVWHVDFIFIFIKRTEERHDRCNTTQVISIYTSQADWVNQQIRLARYLCVITDQYSVGTLLQM